MSKIWVLIDVSFLAYRAARSFGDLELEDVPTGVLFGFFNQLRSICNDPQVRSNKVALFFDSRRSFRAKAYPKYKRQRRTDRTDDERQRLSKMWDQVTVLRQLILPDMGIPTYRQTGVESDDLMAYAAYQMDWAPTKEGVIITSDQDLWQCVSWGCHWYDPMRKVYHNPETFKIAKGIDPSRWGEVKAIAGCTSDNVRGVKRVGELTAVKFLTGTLPPNYEAHKAIVSKKGKKIRARNEELVILPHYRTKHFDLREPDYNVDAFFHHCERYGLISFLQKGKREGWIRFFKGDKHKPRKRKRG